MYHEFRLYGRIFIKSLTAEKPSPEHTDFVKSLGVSLSSPVRNWNGLYNSQSAAPNAYFRGLVPFRLGCVERARLYYAIALLMHVYCSGSAACAHAVDSCSTACIDP